MNWQDKENINVLILLLPIHNGNLAVWNTDSICIIFSPSFFFFTSAQFKTACWPVLLPSYDPIRYQRNWSLVRKLHQILKNSEMAIVLLPSEEPFCSLSWQRCHKWTPCTSTHLHHTWMCFNIHLKRAFQILSYKSVCATSWIRSLIIFTTMDALVGSLSYVPLFLLFFFFL